ncbi:hypothetical protein A3196_00370 [Candidatus Thiodiazotropha endoloripes]|uniref:Uncharacterized protein n=1 Tax=Candidatus Thiodiazotropha endoloripes TaxID=1818881 RepID=A0A1E2ULD3_9GAMM|nr:hypothetical protein A3196_00370 [Candidatus Thiodiazotropha endoloripes]
MLINLWQGTPPGSKLEADGSLFADIATASADHAVLRQAALFDTQFEVPGCHVRIAVKAQSLVFAGLYAIAAKCALGDREIDFWKTGRTQRNDLLGAGFNAVVAAFAKFSKAAFRLRPGWSYLALSTAQVTT